MQIGSWVNFSLLIAFISGVLSLHDYVIYVGSINTISFSIVVNTAELASAHTPKQSLGKHCAADENADVISRGREFM